MQDTEFDPLEELAAAYLEQVRNGETISVDAFALMHPEHAEEIRELFPAIEAMESLKQRNHSQERPVTLQGLTVKQLGEYTVVREIGRGGMGIVFEAMQESLNRRVAIKVLPSASMMNETARKRFDREVHIAASLEHPNIVPIFSVGEDQGLAYFAMQFIDGKAWHERLAETRRKKANGRFDRIAHYRQVAYMAYQAAAALAFAHGKGVLHRDIKPANLLVDSEDHVWVTDFGLAKVSDDETLTRSGNLVGTFRYLAPERFEDRIDARSDIYSLGISLYELTLLRPAYGGQSKTALMKQIVQGQYLAPSQVDPNIPPALDIILCRAIAADPTKRYPSAQAMADDLLALVKSNNTQVFLPKPKTWTTPAKLLLFAGLFGLAVLLGYLLSRPGDTPAPASVTPPAAPTPQPDPDGPNRWDPNRFRRPPPDHRPGYPPVHPPEHRLPPRP